MIKNRFQFIFISIIFICYNSNLVSAQSLIAGIPSADVAPEGKLIFTHESQINSWKYDKVKWNSFNFLCYGVSKNTEFTISFSNLSNSPVSHESIGIGFKKLIDLKFLKLPESKFAFGQNVLFSLNQPTVGGWSYAMLSSRLPVIKSRLTAGVSYGSAELFGYDTITTQIGNEKIFEVKRRNPFSYMIGLEQPIIEKRLGIIADWFSGSHDLSALITGIQFEFNHLILISGYKFPNYEPVKNGAIIFEAMYEF